MFDTIRILETLKEGADLHIFFHSSYGLRKWSVKLEKESDGTKLEIKVTGETLDEAVDELNSKFRKAVGQGLKELDLPVLEYNPIEPALEPAPPEDAVTIPPAAPGQGQTKRIEDDDEIPF